MRKMQKCTFLLFFGFLLTCYGAVTAHATTVTVQTFTIPDYRYGGNTAKIRLYSSGAWTDSDGVPHVAGNPASATGFYQEITCTVSGTNLVVPQFTTPSTTNAVQNNSVRITAVLWDHRGVRRDTLFANWAIPHTTPTTWTALAVYNSAVPKPQPNLYASVAEVSVLITNSTQAMISETPTGAINGVNQTFTLSQTPVANSELLFLNGVLQTRGALGAGTESYTITGTTITHNLPPQIGDLLRVEYRTAAPLVGSPGGGGSGVTTFEGRQGNVVSQIGDYTKAEIGLGNVPDVDATNAANISSGFLPIARIQDASITNAKLQNSSITITAGTGLSGGGSVQLGGTVVLNSTAVTSVTGTPNQVTASPTTGDVVLSLPQNIHTGATPQFAGLGIGTATPDRTVEIVSNSGQQFRLTHTDGVQYTDLQTGASGTFSILPTGNIEFNTTGNQINPQSGFEENLGQISKKYLSLHAAELFVETLVAQDSIATIGGRVLVAPTTTLTADLPAAATSIVVKHNQMVTGDVVYLQTAGQVEFMAVTAGPSGVGPYTYTVTRGLGGSGADDWFAGDAVLNTGTTGDGFIDVYSLRGVKSATEIGPTIVGNIRNSTTFNDWSPHWALGNLNGLYGYGVDTLGVALGKYAAGTPHVTIDSTNGYRIFSGLATVVGQWDNAGNIIVGQVAAGQSNVQITSGGINIRNNTTTRINLDSTGAGFVANGNFAWDASGNATIASWAINSNRITSGSTHVAASFDIPAGAMSWYGQSAAGYRGLSVRDAANRQIDVLANNSTIYPYVHIFDGTRARVVLGGLNNNWGAEGSVNSIGMKIWSSAGTKLVEFSDVLNQIGGWTIGATTITSSTVTLDSVNGVSVTSAAAFSNSRAYRILNGSGANLGSVFGATSGSVHTFSLLGESIAAEDTTVTLQANAPASQTAQIGLTVFGNGAGSASEKIQLFHSSVTRFIRADSLNGVLVAINNIGASLTASAALDVQSTTGAFLPPRMTTAQRDALTPTNGMIIYCTDCGTGTFQGRANGAWVGLH
jgi:hypothetical protein